MEKPTTSPIDVTSKPVGSKSNLPTTLAVKAELLRSNMLIPVEGSFLRAREAPDHWVEAAAAEIRKRMGCRGTVVKRNKTPNRRTRRAAGLTSSKLKKIKAPKPED